MAGKPNEKAGLRILAFENKKFLNENVGGTAPATSASGVAGRVSSYSVVRGDNLWNISGKDEVYADPYQWPLIYKANSGSIQDADLIFPGQVLGINTAPSAGDVQAAIHHARNRGAWSIGPTEASDRNYLAQ